MSTTLVKRASLEELLDFANKVRAAGGGNPLSALMPAVPEDAQQCLIAKNLNFNCSVGGLHNATDAETHEPYEPMGAWMMIVDEDLARKLSEALGLPLVYADAVHTTDREWAVALPPEIGQVAADFDAWAVALVYEDDNSVALWEKASKADIQRLKDFWPYIDASIKEDYANATFVTEDGKLVL